MASRPPPLRGRSAAAAVSGLASPSLVRTERGRRSHPHRTLLRRAAVASQRHGDGGAAIDFCVAATAAFLRQPRSLPPLSPSKAAVAARLLPRGDGALPLLLPSAATLSPPLLLSEAAVAARPPSSREEGAEALLIPSAAALPPNTIVEQSSSGLASFSVAEMERCH